VHRLWGLASHPSTYKLRTSHSLLRHSYTPLHLLPSHHISPPSHLKKTFGCIKNSSKLFAISLNRRLTTSLVLWLALSLITMSSSPSSMNSKTHITPGYHSPYRRVDYCDGKSVRIVESRRRPRVVLSKGVTLSSRVPQSAPNVPKAPQKISYSTCPTPRISNVCPSTSIEGPRDLMHVTSNSRPERLQTKAIVVQTLHTVNAAKSYDTSKLDNLFISTPPPTPKFERLPTPDLDDLDERPFCNCCVDTCVVKYCVACGKCLKGSGY
jgi:hypothetical protein